MRITVDLVATPWIATLRQYRGSRFAAAQTVDRLHAYSVRDVGQT